MILYGQPKNEIRNFTIITPLDMLLFSLYQLLVKISFVLDGVWEFWLKQIGVWVGRDKWFLWVSVWFIFQIFYFTPVYIKCRENKMFSLDFSYAYYFHLCFVLVLFCFFIFFLCIFAFFYNFLQLVWWNSPPFYL